MADDTMLHVGWGPFMASCYVSLMEGDEFGPILQISREGPGDAATLLAGLTKHKNAKIPLDEARRAMPLKDTIAWTDEFKGDKHMGYEIRGKADGFRAWVEVGTNGLDEDLTEEQRQSLLARLTEARDTLFPG